MEITSLKFAVLAITAVFVQYFIPPRLRVVYLLMLSVGFISTFDFFLPVYLIFYAFVNYFLGKRLPFSKNQTFIFRVGIVLNLTQLLLLRYASFAIDPLFELIKIDTRLSVLSEILLPVGISYYTLQGIGYLINIKMGWEKPEGNFFRFLLYIIFFPKFLSGPIERSNHFLQQVAVSHKFDPHTISSGLRTALQGYFKKIIIANHLANAVTQLYSSTGDYTGCQIIAIILMLPLYLYFDFSGYSDIAIGFSRALGINIVPNFNRPFLAENMTTFWRRFHISLSSWFNDYVFKQTSFRLKKLKGNATIIAVFLTWILFGIWHGAGWNFMVLGLLQALVIYYEFRTKKIRSTLFSIIPGYSRQLTGRLFTYSFYAISLTFFFAPDLASALRIFSEILSPIDLQELKILNGSVIFGLTFVTLFLLYEILQNDFVSIYNRINLLWTNNILIRIVVYYLALVLILTQLDGSASFIYEMF